MWGGNAWVKLRVLDCVPGPDQIRTTGACVRRDVVWCDGSVKGLTSSISVRQARWREGKKKREEGGQQRQTMRFCDAFIPPCNLHPRPRKDAVPKMREKNSS